MTPRHANPPVELPNDYDAVRRAIDARRRRPARSALNRGEAKARAARSLEVRRRVAGRRGGDSAKAVGAHRRACRARWWSSRRRSAASPICCSKAPPPRPPGRQRRCEPRRGRVPAPSSRGRQGAAAGRARRGAAAGDDRRRGARVPRAVRRRRRARAPRAARERPARLARRAHVGVDPGRGAVERPAAGGVRRRDRDRRDRRQPRRRRAACWRRRPPGPRGACVPLLEAGTIAVVPGFIGRAAGRQRHDARARRIRSDGDAARRARSARQRVVLLEGRARHPDRRPAPRRRCPADPAAASSRSRRSRALRREGPAPARADPDRRHAHRAARAVVRRSRSARHRGLGAARRCRSIRSRRWRSSAARRSSPSPARAWSASTASPRGRSSRSTPSGSRSRRSSRRRRRARSASRCRKARPIAPSPACGTRSATSSPSGLIDNVTARRGMAVVAVVGDGMVGTPGIAARVFSALAAAGINVVAIAQGSSERNISFVVSADQATEAARRVHAAFQLSKIGGGGAPAAPRTDVVLLGFGRVGRALADQIVGRQRPVGGARRRPARSIRLRLRAARPLAAAPAGPDAREGRRRAAGGARRQAGGGGRSADGHGGPRRVAAGRRRRHERETRAICSATALGTASTSCSPTRSRSPDRGRATRSCSTAATRGGRQLKYEATVGAGLPIIDTYQKLVETGDRVLRIEGCVSGTLMYVVSAVSAGKPFSQAVREAVERATPSPIRATTCPARTPRARR